MNEVVSQFCLLAWIGSIPIGIYLTQSAFRTTSTVGFYVKLTIASLLFSYAPWYFIAFANLFFDVPIPYYSYVIAGIVVIYVFTLATIVRRLKTR